MMKMKNQASIRVNTREFLDQVLPVLKEGKTIVIPVCGQSMAPFLKNNRDRVELRFWKDQEELKPGVIALYKRPAGDYILHRIIRKQDNALVIRGDNCSWEEEVDSSWVYGVVSRAERNGNWINETDRVWKFYANAYSQSALLRKCFTTGVRIKRRFSSVRNKGDIQ